MIGQLRLSFGVKNPEPLWDQLLDSRRFGTGPAPIAYRGGTNTHVGDQHFASIAQGARDAYLKWPLPQLAEFCSITIAFNGMLKAQNTHTDFDAREVVEILRGLPFETATALEVNRQWWPDYHGHTFGDAHFGFGWMCGLKGAGHERLTSRRQLSYGPWRLVRDEATDLSFVQFHDLEVTDEQEAFRQARPGHDRMYDATLYRPPLEHRKAFEPSFYNRDENVMIVVVANRTVTADELAMAAHVKYFKPFTDKADDVRFVFTFEHEARKHAFDIWRYGLQCHTFVDGRHVDVLADFEPPPPVVPDWVKRVRDREGF